MTFEEILDQAIEMLQRRRRVTYRVLKRQFDLDDDALEDLKEDILYSHPQVADDEGKGLIWTGDPEAKPELASAPPAPAQQEVTQQGQPAIAEPPTPDAERRQLTVMFCDLADSTRLSGQLDPEDLRDVIRAYQSTSAEVIERYDGYIAQHLGDGLMVYFGWPQAHEDDARRAVHAGLGVLDAVGGLNTRLQQDKGIRLTVRVGIHTGLVVVGEIGSGASQEHLALGETPNIAARIEGVAESGTVAISADTRQLVQGYFDCNDLGLHTLKGVDEPQSVYRVMGESGLESRFLAATTTGLTALVGREEEIALLCRRWSQAKAGEGQVVLLSGEAGIGKSRITGALRERIANEPHLDMHYQCSPYHTNTAFYPITEQFAFAAGFTRHDTPDEKLDKLEAHLRQIGLVVPEVAPLFADALSIPTADRYLLLDVTPQRQKERTIEALAERLLAAAKQRPVLFIAEDLHWSDPSSLETIGRIMAQLADARVLMVCTYRPDFAVPWGLDGPITTFRLNRLSRSQTAALIDAVTAGKSFPRDVVEQIVAKSDGVPLYVEELTKHVLESGWLDDKEDHYGPKGTLPLLVIPVTLQDALTARLDRLSEAREVAQLGAVLGREFSYPMLQTLTTLDDAMLQARLKQLVEAELVYQRGRPPQAAYTFKHALIQDAAYQSLLRRTRQDYHQRVAQMLVSHFPDTVETQPELLAHHYTEAGQAEDAIGYWQRAGQHALQRSAYVEAIAHLAQGLDLLLTLPKTSMRLSQELDLQVGLAHALRVTKGNAAPDTERAYGRARELCEQIKDTPQLFPVLRGLILYYSTRGELQTAYKLAEQLLRLAQSRNDQALLLLAHYGLGRLMFLRGEAATAHTHHTRALAIYTPQDHRALALRYGIDLGVASGGLLALELWQLGSADQAIQHSQKTLRLAQEVCHPYSLALAQVFAAVLYQYRREAWTAHVEAEAVITLAVEQGFSHWSAMGTVLHGWSLAMQGEGEAGIAEMRQGLAADLDTGSKQWQPYFLGLLAEAYGEAGHPEEGLPLLAEGLAVMDSTEMSFYAAELYRLKGILLLKQVVPDETQAEACFLQALDVARAQQAKSWELRAATSLARLWQSQGKRQAAYELLAPVYGWFTEGFDTADLKDAKALLEELG